MNCTVVAVVVADDNMQLNDDKLQDILNKTLSHLSWRACHNMKARETLTITVPSLQNF